MSTRAATVLFDHEELFSSLSDDNGNATPQAGTKESKTARAARTRPTLVSNETTQELGFLRTPFWVYHMETPSENATSSIEKSILEDFGCTEPGNIAPDVDSTEASTENSKRIKLLARKYARKGLTPEENARLEIVSERVRQLMPRVTEADLEGLEKLFQEVERIREVDKDVRQKLGIENNL